MTPERWEQVKAEFLRVMDLPAEERAGAIAELRARDGELGESVETMVSAGQDTGFLMPPTGPETPEPAGDQPLPRIEGYEVLEQIGAGGMGVVHRARQIKPDRVVALKVLRPHPLMSERDLERFHREANAIAKVLHPNVVTVHEVGVSGGNHFFSMELVRGRNLGVILEDVRRGAGVGSGAGVRPKELPAFGERGYVRAAAEIAARVADALAAAHAHRIVHRDVKPTNILVAEDGQVKLVDFGVARDESQGQMTITRENPGTPDYMSPEQIRASRAAVDHRTDVYSLGAVLYQILTLRRPYEGVSQFELPGRIVSPQPPKSIGSLNPKTPRDLQLIVETAMAKDARDRYATAAEFRDDLLRFLAHEAVAAKPRSVMHRARLWLVRNRAAIVLICASALVIGSGTLAMMLRAARNASLAWIDVDSDAAGSTVELRRYEPATLLLEPEGRLLGTAPLSAVSVPPGHYRITIAAGEAFAEFDLLLTATGPGNTVRVRAGKAPAGAGVVWGKLATVAETVGGMVRVEAGEYLVGRSADDPQPVVAERRVPVEGCYLDEREVSNSEFAQFLKATGWPVPAMWSGKDWGEAGADMPATGVRLDDAQAYARWVGKRLPTMFEWQAGTRGVAGWKFPWGNEPGANGAETEPPVELLIAEQIRSDPARIERFRANVVPTGRADPLTTANGMIHAFGNVREFTSTIDLAKHGGVVMGRAFVDSSQQHLGVEWMYPLGTHSIHHGFRCAKSARAPQAKGSP